ncbi:conserved hypothetical protein [Coccidioides posadasii str. Silveira]|uniref:Uncharacterized protein n=1 Tax=Coccidioides posadasii (strain RMSCC 757 / Silveira) TaxID=443226 RepID=E9CTZ5_COCPS|nr:conserved hypothetical protein [Coccidioides posadasii str. Silveira]
MHKDMHLGTEAPERKLCWVDFPRAPGSVMCLVVAQILDSVIPPNPAFVPDVDAETWGAPASASQAWCCSCIQDQLARREASMNCPSDRN